MNFPNLRFLYILVLCGLCFFSFQAEAFRAFEELESFLNQFKDLRSVPMPRTFHADSERTAAGILHYAIDDEKGPVILLGLRDDDKGLCSFRIIGLLLQMLAPIKFNHELSFKTNEVNNVSLE